MCWRAAAPRVSTSLQTDDERGTGCTQSCDLCRINPLRGATHALERTFVDVGSGPAAHARVFFVLLGLGLEEVSGGVGMCLPPLRDTQVVFGVEGAPCRFAPSGLPVSRSPAVPERRCVKCPSLKCAINLPCWSHARPQPLPVPARTHARTNAKYI